MCLRKSVEEESLKELANIPLVLLVLGYKISYLPHAATAHFPGRLSLCIGMPVMIRNNDVTELCITKGQEGFIAG